MCILVIKPAESVANRYVWGGAEGHSQFVAHWGRFERISCFITKCPYVAMTFCIVFTAIRTGIHGSIKYGWIPGLFFKRELRIADHYLRPLSESYITI